MKITHTKIDVHNDELTLEFDGEIIWFIISKAMKHPSDDEDQYG